MKRILYKNPDAEFVFCAGDDKVFSSPLLEREVSAELTMGCRLMKTCSARCSCSRLGRRKRR